MLSNLIASEGRWAAGQNETSTRRGVQHSWDCVEELSDTFTLNKATAVQDEWRPRRPRAESRGACFLAVINTVSDHPNFCPHLRIVSRKQVALGSRQRDQPIRCGNGLILSMTVRKPGIGLVATGLFASVASSTFRYCKRPHQTEAVRLQHSVPSVGPFAANAHSIPTPSRLIRPRLEAAELVQAPAGRTKSRRLRWTRWILPYLDRARTQQ